MARRSRKYTPTLVLAALVLLASALVVWSRRQVPDSVREERMSRVLRALRREQIQRVEVQGSPERFELFKDHEHWQLSAAGRRFAADDTEVERALTEAEFAQPTRRLGRLDAAARDRFGLVNPRARVTLREEHGATVRFAVGGAVPDEPSAYAEVDGEGYVVPRSFADVFVQHASDFREHTLSDLEPLRLTRLEFDGEGGTRVLERSGAAWRLTTPADGRAARARVESLLNDLRDLRATRFLADDPDPARLAAEHLAPPVLTVRAVRDRGGPPVTFRFGGPCEGREDEVTVLRDEGHTLACVAKATFDDFARPAQELRDDKLVWARGDEVERVRVHAPSGEFSLVREGDGFRAEGTDAVDPESVDAWLTALASLSVESREDASTAASRGLAPAAHWFELTRTGVDGVERVDVGGVDTDHVYARREGDPVLLGLDPSAADTLRVDAARFRSRHVIRDVPDELVALATETPDFRDDAVRGDDGAYHLARPFSALADPAATRAAAQRLASLDADRWVALTPEPSHGLAAPRARIVARFEGDGPDPEPGANDGGADASVPRVREYTVTLGASAPSGGVYATVSGKPGVFVLPQAAVDELVQPRVERVVLAFDRERVTRLELTRPRAQGGGTERIALRRDGEVWRTDAGAPADRARVGALLERLSELRAPRAFGYGPAPASAQLGAMSVTVVEGGADGGAEQTHRVQLGGPYEGGDEAGVYARREGLDATLSVPRAVAEAIRGFTP